MLNATSRLVSDLFGSVFVSWISSEPCLYLISLVCLGLALKYLISIFKL